MSDPAQTQRAGIDPYGTQSGRRAPDRPLRYSLFGLLTLILLVALGSALAVTLTRLRAAQTELNRLRQETGYLAPSGEDEIAAARLTSDQPMTYRLRVRVPASPPYRIAYSTLWPDSKSSPQWYGAVSVPPGESVLIVRLEKDPRDERWKITMLRRGPDGTRRIATVLPQDHVAVFRGSHDWLGSGIAKQTSTRPAGGSLRLLDERVLVGEGAMMLYGDSPPPENMIGVFVELQPDIGSI
jgi:hypothetical protein